MKLKPSNNNKIILSSALIVLLIAIVVGLTYAIFEYTNLSNINSISTGRISMSYTEPTNALILENAYPMSDEEGLKQSNYFEFSVTSHATTNNNKEVIEIPYEINISDITIDEGKVLLPRNSIKLNLVKLNGTSEEEIVKPSLLSNLSASELSTSSIIYETIDVHRNGNDAITTTYRLRTWIDKDFDISNKDVYQYKFRVNINSSVDSNTPLKLNRVMLEVWEEDKTLMNDNISDVIQLANETSGKWVEVTNERLLDTGEKIRITFIYNKYIQGEVPALSLKFGYNEAKGTISAGAIEKNKLSYEYTINNQDNGTININNLNGGSITDFNNAVSTIEITQEIKDSLKGYAEVQSNLAKGWKSKTENEGSYLALYALDQAKLPNTYTYNDKEYVLDATIDVSEQKSGGVLLGEYKNEDEIIAVITQRGGVIAPENSAQLFYYLTNIKEMDLSHFDTRNVTTMNHMFTDLQSLTSLNLTSFDTSNVTDMGYMFDNCYNLKSLNLTSFNTSKVTRMNYMFDDCGLTELDLSNFDTSNVIEMDNMFYGTTLTELDLSNFDTSKVTSMYQMFMYSRKLNYIKVGCKWKISAHHPNMFEYCGTSSVTKVCP